jgi:hypothetical protein
MIDRELLKRAPSPGRSLEKPALSNHAAGSSHTLRPLQPCLARWNGAKSTLSSRHPGNPG